MTQIRRRLGDYVSSRFLNSAMVLGKEGPATITHVSEEEVRDDRKEGGRRLAVLVHFDRWPDVGLDLNATNIRALQDMFGEDVGPDDLRGRRVYVGTHQTNFGRGVLLSPAPGTIHEASAAARQRIANAQSAVGVNARGEPPVPLSLVHSHAPPMPCSPDGCDVARARSLGHEVLESWPAPPNNAGGAGAPAPFVPQHQPPTSGQASTTSGQASTTSGQPNADSTVAPPELNGPTSESQRHAEAAIPPPSDDDIPF